MSSLKYKGRQLCFGGHDLTKLSNRFASPFYLYDLAYVRRQALALKSALPKDCLIQYAMKANSNSHILSVIKKSGMGVDVVSLGELKLAMKAGFRSEDIVFSGVGKTKEELEFSIRKNIRSINVESYAELERVLEIALRLKRVARVSLRLNPNVHARTHRHITTGKDYNKFGLSPLELRQARELLNSQRARLRLVGLTFHLGSQIQALGPYQLALKKVKPLLLDLISDGHPMEHMSIGGGLAIRYQKERPFSLKQFGSMVRKLFKDLPVRAMIEPGRILVGEAGVLLTEVQYVKDTGKARFAIVDTGMHHLMRPALYDAYHEILPLQKKTGISKTYEVVGPICESTDVLGRNRKFADLQNSDRLAILNAGAYGFVMSNRYNHQSTPAEILLDGNRIIKS